MATDTGGFDSGSGSSSGRAGVNRDGGSRRTPGPRQGKFFGGQNGVIIKPYDFEAYSMRYTSGGGSFAVSGRKSLLSRRNSGFNFV